MQFIAWAKSSKIDIHSTHTWYIHYMFLTTKKDHFFLFKTKKIICKKGTENENKNKNLMFNNHDLNEALQIWMYISYFFFWFFSESEKNRSYFHTMLLFFIFFLSYCYCMFWRYDEFSVSHTRNVGGTKNKLNGQKYMHKHRKGRNNEFKKPTETEKMAFLLSLIWCDNLKWPDYFVLMYLYMSFLLRFFHFFLKSFSICHLLAIFGYLITVVNHQKLKLSA